jgi:glycosyltransferase involved in cell wall biosynthesis
VLNMEYPLVSAIVLCYKQARFVRECLEAVKLQNYPNLELIVNDDASDDGSAEVIEPWLAGCGIPHKLLQNEVNLGLCRSLNNAISQARGKYIAGIAADDIWLAGKLLRQVEIMETLSSRVGVLYSDALQMDENGKPLQRRFIETYRCFETMPQGDIQTSLWEGNFIPAMTTLIRRECFDKVGLYDETLYYEDWDMWLRIAREFEFAFSDQISATYRMVSTSMMQTQIAKILDSACQVCRKHLKNYKMEPGSRRAAIIQFRDRAILSFKYATPFHRRNLCWALRYNPCPQVALRLLFSCCGLGAGQFDAMRARLRKPFGGTVAATSSI